MGGMDSSLNKGIVPECISMLRGLFASLLQWTDWKLESSKNPSSSSNNQLLLPSKVKEQQSTLRPFIDRGLNKSEIRLRSHISWPGCILSYKNYGFATVDLNQFDLSL